MLRGKGHVDVVSKLGDVVIPPLPTIVRSPLKPAITVEKRPENGDELSNFEPGDPGIDGEDTPVGSAHPAAAENHGGDDPAELEEDPLELTPAEADIPRSGRDAGELSMPAIKTFGSRGEQSSSDKGEAAVLVPDDPVQPIEMRVADPVVAPEPGPAAVSEPNPTPTLPDPTPTLNVEPVVVTDLGPVGPQAVAPVDLTEPELVEAPVADPVAVPKIEPVDVPTIEPVAVPKVELVVVPKVEPAGPIEDKDAPAPVGAEAPAADSGASAEAKVKDPEEVRGEGDMPGPSGFGGGMPAMHAMAGGKFGWFCGFEDEDDLQIIIGGDADAVGEHTFADGKITGMIQDKGFVTVGRAQAVFEASADDGDGGFAFANAETFAEVIGADFVFTLTREWHGDEEGGFSSTAADKSVTTVYAIDFEHWSPRHTIEINTTIGMGEFEPDILPDGNIATFEADLQALGDDTFVELFSDAFTVEDQFSTVSGVATLIG